MRGLWIHGLLLFSAVKVICLIGPKKVGVKGDVASHNVSIQKLLMPCSGSSGFFSLGDCSETSSSEKHEEEYCSF